MATIFKTLTAEDVVNSRTYLYEQIPLTGAIASGTYSSSAGETNILNYSHGMFQTVYDYPYLSSSANDIFDITVGLANSSFAYSQATTTLRSKKVNIYNELSKVLYGYDYTGSILQFDRDGNPATSADRLPSGWFFTFSRLLVKDEIKKGTFRMRVGLSGSAIGAGVAESNRFAMTGTVFDYSGTLSPVAYKTNSPSGDYGILFLSESVAGSPRSYNTSQTNPAVGLIFYQAGVVFVSTDLFASASLTASIGSTANLTASPGGQLRNATQFAVEGTTFPTVQDLFLTGTIAQAASGIRRRIDNIQFQNTTELNSTIYFLRANNNEFNYSSNPTYLSGSEIRVKGGNALNAPASYITTAGLYSSDNELLAVAKLSQPLKKTEDQSMILRVRLDY